MSHVQVQSPQCGPLGCTQIPRIAQHRVPPAVQQMRYLREVMEMGRRGLQAMQQTVGRVHPDMQFHAEMPLVPLPGRVHLWIPRLPLVRGGVGRGEYGGILKRALRQTKVLLGQMAIELRKEGIAPITRIQQMAEAQNGALVRHPPQLHPRETAPG